jgi:hypothetical protein
MMWKKKKNLRGARIELARGYPHEEEESKSILSHTP